MTPKETSIKLFSDQIPTTRHDAECWAMELNWIEYKGRRLVPVDPPWRLSVDPPLENGALVARDDSLDFDDWSCSIPALFEMVKYKLFHIWDHFAMADPEHLEPEAQKWGGEVSRAVPRGQTSRRSMGMLTREEADRRVVEGFKHMDATYPRDWAERTNLESLEMSDCIKCMLGIHSGRYDYSPLSTNHAVAVDWGFALNQPDDWFTWEQRRLAYAILTDAWRDAINARLLSRSALKGSSPTKGNEQ